MAINVAGGVTGALAEVESASLAMRITPKPIDYGSLGIYSIGGVTGVMAANLAAASPIFSFRWGAASPNLGILKKVIISAGDTSTAFSAGTVIFNLFRALSFTASDTGGTSILPSGNQNKHRTSMGTTLLTDLRISSTATLTAGTRTLDTNPFASITVSITATAGTPILLPSELFRANAGDYPLVFAQNEGFVIQASVPGTGTWTASINTTWEEIANYVP